MSRAGVCPDSPWDCQYTLRELHWMAEAKAFDEWQHTSIIASASFNSNGYLKKHTKPEDFCPHRYVIKVKRNSSDDPSGMKEFARLFGKGKKDV